MDPTENLAEQLELAQRILAAVDDPDPSVVPEIEDAARLAELVEALHGWLLKHGALPAQWALKH